MGDWQASGFKPLAPALGSARLGMVRPGLARLGPARRGVAPQGEEFEVDGWQALRFEPWASATARTVTRPVPAWLARAWRGGARLGERMGGQQTQRCESSAPTHGKAWHGSARCDRARLGKCGRLAAIEVRGLDAHGVQRRAAGHGTAVLAPVGLGWARQGLARNQTLGKSGRGSARLGVAWPGMESQEA